LDYLDTIQLPGNALSVVTDIPSETGETHILVSIDNIHLPGSVTERLILGGHNVLVTGYEKRKNEDAKVESVLSFTIKDGSLVASQLPLVETIVRSQVEVGGGNTEGRLGGLLYTLENLRKRDGESAEE
jgi:tRNA (guanine-N(7)-)-methyltransferase subunit TRM82